LLRQARKLKNDEKINEALARIRDVYIARMDKCFDPVLSAKIDCLTWLLEN
jgi:hypothetical protein